MLKKMFRILAAFSWALNLASLAGYFLLRRRINSPETYSNTRRFHIIRPYKTNTDERAEMQQGNEQVELQLMSNLFATARDYGNACVVVVTNHDDPGLPQIRRLAKSYCSIVKVVEAPPMPPNTVSGQMFNHKVGWSIISQDVGDDDILLTTDCDSDLTPKLLRQIARAYEDKEVGGVGTYPLYYPAVNWSAMPISMVVNPGFGYLALDTAVRGRKVMIGNLLSMRISVFHEFGGFDGYSRNEELVDDMATTAKVLSTGWQLEQVGMMPVWNRYSTWPGWWGQWKRWAITARISVPDIFFLSPWPTYGGQTINIVVMLYGLLSKKPRYMLPFFANWGVIVMYASITRIWREALLAPVSALLNMFGWVYALVARPKSVRWRGTVVSLKEDEGRLAIRFAWCGSTTTIRKRVATPLPQSGTPGAPRLQGCRDG